MEVLLLIVVLLYILFAYYISGRKIFSPWIIMMASYIPVILIAALNVSKWGQGIHLYTVFMVFIAFSCWGFGDLCGKSVLMGYPVKSIKNIMYLELPKWNCILGVVIGLGVCGAFYSYIRLIAGAAGYSGGIEILKYARYAQLYAEDTIAMPIIVAVGRSFCKAIAYISLYCLISNIMFFKNTHNVFYYSIIQIPYIIVMILSTGRIEIMYYVCYVLILTLLIISMKSNWKNSVNKEIIKKGVIAFVLVIASFWILGYLTGKSSSGGLWDTISIYIGTPIINFDIFLQKPSKPDFFGQETCLLYTSSE